MLIFFLVTFIFLNLQSFFLISVLLKDCFKLNLGQQHSTPRGVLRLVLEMDGIVVCYVNTSTDPAYRVGGIKVVPSTGGLLGYRGLFFFNPTYCKFKHAKSSCCARAVDLLKFGFMRRNSRIAFLFLLFVFLLLCGIFDLLARLKTGVVARVNQAALGFLTPSSVASFLKKKTIPSLVVLSFGGACLVFFY